MAHVHVNLRLEVPDSLLGIDPLDDVLCGEYGNEASDRKYEEVGYEAEQIILADLPRFLEYAVPLDESDVEVDF
jgi:hypothetical protein